MNRYPQHHSPTPDMVPGWARMVLYALAILAPFVALAFGRLEGNEAVAAVVTLFGVLGPAVAVAYKVKSEDDKDAQFRAGWSEAIGQHAREGEHDDAIPDDVNGPDDQ